MLGEAEIVPAFLTSAQDILSLYDDPPNTPKSMWIKIQQMQQYADIYSLQN